ncbi:MAG: CRISPR-associated protein Cas4 [Candidatus Micrarchaeaceae archaeon]
MQIGESTIIPTYVWYYYICKREVWLMSRHIKPNQDEGNIELGRAIHENAYQRDRKEISLPGMKIDRITREGGVTIIGEIKKSSKFLESAKMQLSFYLYNLKKNGIDVEGKLLFPRERREISVYLTDEISAKIEDTTEDIKRIVSSEYPPAAQRIGYCRNCAYREFCWS